MANTAPGGDFVPVVTWDGHGNSYLNGRPSGLKPGYYPTGNAANPVAYDASRLPTPNADRGAGTVAANAANAGNTTKTYTDANGTHLVTLNSKGVVIADQVTSGPSATQARTSTPVVNTGSYGGPTWYEQQQIALDQQRLADARAAQAAQEKYQAEQQAIARSSQVESANQAFRDAQLKSTYGTINGMAYGGAKGSPFAQMLPEPSVLKDAFAANHQVDPWSQPAMYGGYTGSGFMNMQQPGLANQGDPNMRMPTSGTGSAIPLPPASQGQNENVHPELMNIIATHPDANKFALSLPGVKDAVINQVLAQSTPTGGTS